MKKTNRDERLRKRFFKNLRSFCKQNCYTESERNSAEEMIKHLENMKDFNPALVWKYGPVCAGEITGFDGSYSYRHERLFGRNARLLTFSIDRNCHMEDCVTESSVVFLLDDMTFRVAKCVMLVTKSDTCATYVYEEKKRYAELPEHFDVLEFLTEVTDDAEGCVEQFEE